MKKFFYVAIAATALASCSSDNLVDLKEGDEIKFTAVADNDSRAAQIFCNNNKMNDFVVYASVGTNDLTSELFNVSRDEVILFENLYVEILEVLKKYGYFSSSDFKGHGTTYEILQDIGWNLGFDSFVSIKSYIQNIGKRNLCNKDKILKYDDNFKKPVAWNKDF